MSIHVYLLLPPSGHEPPPTLRNCLYPHLSLQRRRSSIPRYAKPPDDVDLYAIGPPFLFFPPPARGRKLFTPTVESFRATEFEGGQKERNDGQIILVV